MKQNLDLQRVDVDAKCQAAELSAERGERRTQFTSLVITVAVHVVVALLLALAVISMGPEEVPQIVAVSSDAPERDNLKKKDFARSVQQKPKPAQSASKVQPIAAVAVSSMSVPSFEEPVDRPLGIGADFGRGFGYGRGNGGGGGGGSISFFGASVKANRAVFIVDFSGSMEEADAAGGTRLQRLKKELRNSLNKLPAGVGFQVIYYSTVPWLGGETMRNSPNRNPKNPADVPPWSLATQEGIATAVGHLAVAQPEGATLWRPPLELALAMRPAPSAIFLLSDGASQDYEEVVDELAEINPKSVPINVIGLELVGPAFKAMVDIARKTGGKHSIVVKGRLYSGAAALRYATDEFEPLPDF